MIVYFHLFCQWLGRQVKTDTKAQQGSLFGNKRTVLNQIIYKWLRHQMADKGFVVSLQLCVAFVQITTH